MSDTNILDLGPKLTGEKIPVAFDFGPDLAAGETLQGTPTIAITVAPRSVARDASPSAVQNGAAAIDGTSTMVVVPTQAGVNGCLYRISVLAPTTNSEKVLELVGYMLVADPA